MEGEKEGINLAPGFDHVDDKSSSVLEAADDFVCTLKEFGASFKSTRGRHRLFLGEAVLA